MFIKAKPLTGRRGLFCVVLLLVLSSGDAGAAVRVWRDVDGKQYAGEYVREISDRVIFQDANGSAFSLKTEDLSSEDITYIRTMVAPKVDVRVSVKTRAQRISEFVQNLEQVWNIDAKIEIHKTSSPAFDGKLKGDICFYGKCIVSGLYVVLNRSSFEAVFPETSGEIYVAQASTQVRQFEHYNEIETRGFEYAGHVLVINDPAGDVLTYDCGLSGFDDQAAPSLLKLPYYTFFDKTGRARSVPRPEYADRDLNF